MITQRNVSVEILTDQAPATLWNRDGSNYFLLSPGAFYAIRIRNETEDDGSVLITLNDSHSAGFRLLAGETNIFETLASNGPRFRFRREDSFQAASQGFKIGDESNGLVEITFYPERRRLQSSRRFSPPPLYRSMSPQSMSMEGEYKSIMPSSSSVAAMAAPLSSSVKSGVTTFEGRSDDVYREVLVPDLDYSRKVNIMFHLVAKPEERSRRWGIPSPRRPPRVDF